MQYYYYHEIWTPSLANHHITSCLYMLTQTLTNQLT